MIEVIALGNLANARVTWGVHLKKDTPRSSSLLFFGMILPCHALGNQRRIFPSTFLFPVALGFTPLRLLIGLTNIIGHLRSARYCARG